MPVPARLGKYEIRREVGRGAIGVVYEGFDPTIGRTVAVKVLQYASPSSPALAEARVRFQREAQAAGRLSHPNIVAVFEYADDTNPLDQGVVTPFIAMEFVRGQDLKLLADTKTRFDLPTVQRIMQQLLAALQHAHEHGVVHRDIKPSNVILCDGNTVKVADFGIARLEDSNLTQTGVVMGTVSHMSPEQLTGSAIDRRTDIYSSGVILYELLTGEPPFVGSATTIMQKILNQEPLPPSTLNPTLPAALDAVVKRALAKSPSARFATAAEFSQALVAAIQQVGPAAEAAPVAPALAPPAPRAHGARRAAVTGAAIIAACAAGYAGFALWKPASGDRAALPISAPTLPTTVAAASAIPPATAAPPAVAASDAAQATATPASAAMKSVTPTLQDIERAAWDKARKADTATAYAAYLKRYPSGPFTKTAQNRLDTLREALRLAQAPPVVLPAPPGPPGPPAPTAPTAPAAIPPGGPSKASAPARAASSKASAPSPVAVAPPRPAAPPPEPAPARVERPTASPAPPAPTVLPPAAPSPDCEARAQAGDRACQLVLAARYRDGQGGPRDLAEAARWYRKAADQGSDVAQYQLSLMYGEGRGVVRDPRDAARWASKAADQGYALAQNRLGGFYERGDGTVQNQVLASDWYRKAADQGLAAAQSNLGRMYRSGRGVFRDADKAAALFRAAAAQGDGNAAYHLGHMFEKGDGVRASTDDAARWYRTALGRPNLHLTQAEEDRVKTFVAQHR